MVTGRAKFLRIDFTFRRRASGPQRSIRRGFHPGGRGLSGEPSDPPDAIGLPRCGYFLISLGIGNEGGRKVQIMGNFAFCVDDRVRFFHLSFRKP